MKLHHGGGLRAAAVHYGIPLGEWLDLSTAINPDPWPVPELPRDIWQRLPEEDDGLHAAAARYYGNSALLPVPGTQSVIETLPRALTPRRVWVPAIGYQEHAYCWQKNGHALQTYTTLPAPERLQPNDIVVIINPNNPTAAFYSPKDLTPLTAALASLNGLLVVDEAFMDCTPEFSLLANPLPEHVIVLRSFGKFFGMAGARLGFVFANETWRYTIENALGPWSVNHPARWIASRALADRPWQTLTRKRLMDASHAMALQIQEMLQNSLKNIYRTGLFITLNLGEDTALSLHDHLAKRAVFTRLFPGNGLLRMGVDSRKNITERLYSQINDWQKV